jgi:hypothetical protein
VDIRIFRPVRAIPALAISASGNTVTVRMSVTAPFVYGALVNGQEAEIVSFDGVSDAEIKLPFGLLELDALLYRYSLLIDVQGSVATPNPLQQSLGFGPSAQLISGTDAALQRAQRLLLRDVGGDPLNPTLGCGLNQIAGKALTTAQAAAMISAACDRYNRQVASSRKSGLHVARISVQTISLVSVSEIRARYGISLPNTDGVSRLIVATLQWLLSDTRSETSAILV